MYNLLISLLAYPIAFTTFAVCLTIYVLLLLFFRPLQLQRLVQFLARLILLTAGQRLKINGDYPPLAGGPYLYLFNHGSYLDAFVLGAVLQGRFTAVAAKKYFAWPLWGWMMSRHNVIPIKRPKIDMADAENKNGLEKAIASMRSAEQLIGAGWSIVGSPEGTRTKGGKLQEFKKGFFHVAINTRAPIVFVVIKGAYRAMNRSSWIVKPGTITVEFSQPWILEDWRRLAQSQGRNKDLDAEELRYLARQIMAKRLDT